MKIINPLKYSAILRSKIPFVVSVSVLASVIAGLCLLGIVMPKAINADFDNNTNASYVAKNSAETADKIAKKIKVIITAYSSTPEETDDTPFITASGKSVADGVVANNMLPLGTKIKIPELYGDKIFVVEDRMNVKKSDYHIDIWLPSKILALSFGVKTTEIEVLEN